MHEFTGTINAPSIDYTTGNIVLQIVCNEKQAALACYNELANEEKLSVKIAKYRERRSLNANNYAWHLINEIANKVRAGKDEVYLTMLKRYGQSEMISVVAAVDMAGFVKYYEEVGESELNGKLFKHYRIYKGSSEYDKESMAIFIDGIVSEAKELGIPTETPEHIANMKSLWGE
jgi:hypothetical protein